MRLAVDQRIEWLKRRGIIASSLAILLGFPGGCALNSERANQLRLVHAEIEVQQGRSRLKTLMDELFQCEEAILDTREKLVRCRAQLDGVDSIQTAKAKELADALGKVQLMEEDLAAARRRQVEITAQLAPLRALEKQVATRKQQVAELAKALPALDAQIAAGTKSVEQKTAELAVLKGRLEEFDRVRKQIEAAVQATLGPAGAGKPKTDPKKDPAKPGPVKKATGKSGPAKQPPVKK